MADRAVRLSRIRRPSRLGAVWLSYRTRWMLCAMAAFVGICFVVITRWIWLTDSDSNSAALATPMPSPAEWFNSTHTDRKIDWKSVRSLTVHELTLCEPLWTAGEIPRLESLTIFVPITDDQLGKLCQLYNLKALTLYDLSTLTAEGLRPLRSETQLEYLQIRGLKKLRDAPSLDWPPNVRTLVCDDSHGISLSRLNEWRQLPHLTTLSTRLVPLRDRLPEEVLDTLRGFPRLKRLFLQELGRHYPNLVTVQQAALPWLIVRPSSYHSGQGLRAGAILGGGFLVMLFLSIQMSSQFLTTASALTPRFGRSHLGPVMGVFVAVALTSFALYVQAGCSILASAALSGAAIFVFACEARLFRFVQNRGGYQMPGMTHAAYLMPFVIFSTIGLVSVVVLYGPDVDWFLGGHQPWLCLIFLIGSLWGSFDLVQWKLGLKRNLEEAGSGNAPLSMLSVKPMNEWRQIVSVGREAEGKRPGFAYRWIDSRMDRFVERMHSRKGINSVALWRLGTGGKVGDTLGLTIAGLVVVGVLAVIAGAIDFELREPIGLVGVPMVAQALGTALIMPFFIAWARRSFQEMELLRPLSRRNWAGVWFQMIGSEMGLDLLIIFIFGVALWWLGQLGDISAADVCLTTVAFIGLTGLIFAIGMCMLTTPRSQPLLIPVMGAVSSMIVFGNVVPIFFRLQDNEWKTPMVVCSTIVGIYALAFAGIWLAWRSWQNWEVGSVS